MACDAALELHIAVPHPRDNLTPVGIIPCNREGFVPATPVVFHSGGAMIINQISFVVIMRIRDGSLRP
eukprot:3333212-Pyramimonas_sp.AAC.1